MITLTIDAGNTSIKCVTWNNWNIIAYHAFDTLEKLSNFFQKENYSIDRIYCSSVLSEERNQILSDLLLPKKILFFSINSNPIPFAIHYFPYEKLGADRILAILGAYYLYPENDFIVIDSGTCLKYGYFSRLKGFLGGFISPGIKMRFHSLHEKTHKLPMIEIPTVDEIKKIRLGTNTSSSVIGGVLYGILGELDKMITIGIKNLNNPIMIFTGGDHEILSSLYSDPELSFNTFKNKIFAEPYLVHYGLKYFFEKIEN